ncbi:MAG: hypothetical protein ACE5F6_09645 [Anaerolineae bacterium]
MDDFPSISADAIRLVRQRIRWKPGKAREHLEKRIRLGHLAPDTTIDEYESVIAEVVSDPRADVFVFVFDDDPYPTVVAGVAGQRWLVMFDWDGIMETAFPPDDADEYLADPQFVRLGIAEDILR